MKKIDQRLILAVLLVVLLATVAFEVSAAYQSRVNAALQVLFMGLLAVVTAYYADRTKEIADGTRELAATTQQQAAATAASVSEMQKQRYQGVRPIIRFAADSLPQIHGRHFVIRNIGPGPAMNVKCWIEMSQPGGGKAFKNNDGHDRQFRTQVLEVGGIAGGNNPTWGIEILPRPPANNPCAFVAVYQDVHGNYFISKASYQPIDFQGTRPLKVVDFSTGELDETQAKELLRMAGYQE